MKRVLITGFDKFGGNATNPSGDLANLLNGTSTEQYEIKGILLPTIYDDAVKKLKGEIDNYNPDVVICTGLFGGRPNITIERVAINITDGNLADNVGKIILNTPIDKNGKNAFFATLPLHNIIKTARAHGIPMAISNTAGTYVCNHIFYTLMNYLTETNREIPAGFIHLPFLPEEVAKNDAMLIRLQV